MRLQISFLMLVFQVYLGSFAQETDWLSLFNGKDLEGWTSGGKLTGLWKMA